jgi:hypothetical protein
MQSLIFDEPYVRVTRLDHHRAVITFLPPGVGSVQYVTSAVVENRTVLGPRRDTLQDAADVAHDEYVTRLVSWNGVEDSETLRKVLDCLEAGVLETHADGLRVTDKTVRLWGRAAPAG